MKLMMIAEKTRLNRGRDRWSRRSKQPHNEPKEPEHHERMQAKQIGLDLDEYEPGSNQSDLGDYENQTRKTREQLMQKPLELRNQKDQNQTQPYRADTENTADNPSRYGKKIEEAGTEN